MAEDIARGRVRMTTTTSFNMVAPLQLIECAFHCHAIRNKIKKYSGLSKEIVILWTINREGISPSLRCVRCPKGKIFVQLLRAKL